MISDFRQPGFLRPGGRAQAPACSPIRRDVPLKTERLRVRILPRGPFGMSTGRASRASVLTSAPFFRRVWRKSTAFRQPSPGTQEWVKAAAPKHMVRRRATSIRNMGYGPASQTPNYCARSSKRAGGLINRIALDQCRVPERYRTRVPTFARGFGWQAKFLQASTVKICHRLTMSSGGRAQAPSPSAK